MGGLPGVENDKAFLWFCAGMTVIAIDADLDAKTPLAIRRSGVFEPFGEVKRSNLTVDRTGVVHITLIADGEILQAGYGFFDAAIFAYFERVETTAGQIE